MKDQNPAYLRFSEALELFSLVDVIALDTETNGYDIRDGRGYAYGISLAARLPGVGVVSTYIPLRHPNGPTGLSSNLGALELAQLKKKIESYAGTLIFHNAKFDLESLRTLGINYTGRFYCTMIMAHLINENIPFSKSLDSCGKHYLKDPGKKMSPMFDGFLKLYGWVGMLPEIIFEYAAYDADLTLRLFETLLPKFNNEQLEDYWRQHKEEFFTVIRTMERRGVCVDIPFCRKMAVLGQNAMEDIIELLGDRKPSGKNLEHMLLDELGLPVVKRSKKTGNPSFDKDAMKLYEEMLVRTENPLADYILSYRGWQKSVSSNYLPYVELISPDGRLRCNYKLHGTKTGRMSCEKPNLQQIPRSGKKAWNGELKQAFIAAEGYTLWEADYGQLELRLATAYANETGLKRVFAEGRDIFTEMSKQIGMARQDTKTLTYTIQYGGGINRISTVFGVSAERAGQIRENFYLSYPGFRAKANIAQSKARAKGKLRLWSGRYRHFLYPQDEAHKGFNSIIQGGAADIVERTMVRLFNTVDHEEECRMLLQVHDSIVFEIKNGLESKYLPMIKKCMENVEPDFGVRFAVDIHKWGTEESWNEAA
jgi:DNA polymerase-1